MGTHTGGRGRRIKASRTRRRDRYWGLMKVPRLGSPGGSDSHRPSLSFSVFYSLVFSLPPCPFNTILARRDSFFLSRRFPSMSLHGETLSSHLPSFSFLLFSSLVPTRLNRVLNIAPSRPRTAAAELFMTTLEIHIHPWHSSRIRPRFGSYRPRRPVQIMQYILPLPRA